MRVTIERPGTAAPAGGLLGFEQFQTAYVTNDIDQAMQRMGDEYGVGNWTEFTGTGGSRIALAWVRGQQLEIIDPLGTDNAFYSDWIAGGQGFALRFHHFGYFVNGDLEWTLLKQQLAIRGVVAAAEREIPLLKYIYIKAPLLGHYLEYIQPSEAGKAFFENVAVN